MNKELIEKKPELQDPRESLEKVLITEIELANQISEAREEADKSVLSAQSSTTQLKARLLEEARAERDRLFKEGVQKARQEAEKGIQAAEQEAKSFLKNGRKYLEEAGERVSRVLLGLDGGAK